MRDGTEYQPDETIRLDVRLENETVWLTQSQMGELFGCTTRNVRLHLENIYSCGELVAEATRKDFFLVRLEGARQVHRKVTCYNLDAIISVGYRVNSILGVKFRQWATKVLKEYLLRGYSVNARLAQLEDKVDRRLAKTEADVAELKDKVDFFVQTKEPPVREIFYDGQFWEARSLVLKLIERAKRSLILIDNWAMAKCCQCANVANYQCHFPMKEVAYTIHAGCETRKGLAPRRGCPSWRRIIASI